MLLTVILPVFNAETVLNKSIESLLRSKNKFNVELILINDGSTDNSLRICLDYQNKYDFIKVIDIVNSGPSLARNAGLKMANGDFICFVDSDDYVEDNYVEIIFKHLNLNADILIFGFNKIHGQQVIQNKFKSRRINHNEILDLISHSASNMNLLWYPWTKVYKATSIQGLRFNKNINIGEDTIFNIEAFVMAELIVIIDHCLYNYVSNENSLTQAKYKSNLLPNMEQHFKSRLLIHNRYRALSGVNYFNDIAKYYVNHILFWLLSNSTNNPSDGSIISDLKNIRNSDIFSFSFKYYKFTGITVKQKFIILLFKFRFFYLLSTIYKNA